MWPPFGEFQVPDLQERKIVVVGLGYVGLPLAVALGRHVP